LLKLHAEDIAEPYLDAYCSVTNTPRAKMLDWRRTGWQRTFPMIGQGC
jgi:hypothetical protein